MRVLVVGDELRMAALLKRGPEKDGYAVDVVCTGTDAVWQANEFGYDAVVLDAGADDYLTKPFSFAELSARMRALIRRGVVERANELNVADLRLDPATRRVWRGPVELELSAKEFALLELFLRHPEQVLTRTRILEHVWDSAYDGVSNLVDQYVLYLRHKIDRPFGVEQLETVRGAGYRLCADPATVGVR